MINVLNFGVKNETNPFEVRKIQATNFFLILSFIPAFISSVFNISNDSPRDRIITFSFAVICILFIWLNHLRFHTFAKLAYLFIASIFIFYGADEVGKESGVTLFFINLSVFAFLIFDIKQWVLICIYIVFVSALVYALEYSDYEIFSLNANKSKEDLAVDFVFNLIASVFLFTTSMFFIAFNYGKIEEKVMATEKSELEKSDILKEIMDASDASIWAIDEKFRIIHFNKIFNEGIKESYGISLYEGFDVDDENNYGTKVEKFIIRKNIAEWRIAYTRAMKGESFEETHNISTIGGTLTTKNKFRPIQLANGKTGAVIFSVMY